MSAVDVIDAAINKVRQHAWPQTMDLEEARAAVAELIEAAAEVDKLSRGIGDWSDESNVEKAVLRQRAALAIIGAAP